jgi:uncharacterized membrane protein YkvA (DUF1232 family)
MKWKEKARRLRDEVYALFLSFRDKRMPWYAKVFIIAIVAYALSPIDLIPDFIPVLGYIDDLIIVPAGVYLALRMVPAEIREVYRQKAADVKVNSKAKWSAAAVIIVVWMLALYLIISTVRL